MTLPVAFDSLNVESYSRRRGRGPQIAGELCSGPDELSARQPLPSDGPQGPSARTVRWSGHGEPRYSIASERARPVL